MNKRERVLTVVNGLKADKVPAGFWLHFPPAAAQGEAALAAHLRFFNDSGTDICKVMNENLLTADPHLQSAADWAALQPFSTDSDLFTRQVELVRSIVAAVGDSAVVLATIHGVVASASHVLGGPTIYDTDRDRLVRDLRENPEAMRLGLAKVADYLAALTRACLEAGADGIYYAALGGEENFYTDAEFAEFIRPLDLRVMAAASGRKGFNVLHVCKDHLNLERYRGYPGDVVNWGVFSANPSLTDGRAIFPDKVLLGGLDDRSGVLVDGSHAEIAAAVQTVLQEAGDGPFILGADCTLPTDIDPARIRAAVAAAVWKP